MAETIQDQNPYELSNAGRHWVSAGCLTGAGLTFVGLAIIGAKVAHFLSTSEGAKLIEHIRASASQIFSQ